MPPVDGPRRRADGRTLSYLHAGGRIVACVEMLGHAPAAAVLDLRYHAQYEHEVRLVPVSAPRRPEVLDNGYRVAHGGVRVHFPLDSVVDPDGHTVGPDFEVTIADLDPADPRAGLLAAPGPLQADGGATLLESVRMADIALWRGTQRLQLAAGARAALELDVSPDHPGYARLTPGSPVPAWSYDLQAGEWIREGDGLIVERDGRRIWTAEVGHFSWWNADLPASEKDCFDIQIKIKGDIPSNFLGDIAVTMEGVNFGGVYTAITDATGHACVEAPEGDFVLNANDQPATQIEIYAGTLNQVFSGSEVLLLQPSDGVPAGDALDSTGCGEGACKPYDLILEPLLCDNGALKSEWNGLPGDEKHKPCQAAEYSCKDGVWNMTLPEVSPEDEVLDNKDNDCNGVIDDGVGGNCAGILPENLCTDHRPVGICEAGFTVCENNTPVCQAPNKMPPQAPEEELANTLDDEDCDGWPAAGDLNYLLLGGSSERTLYDSTPWGNGLAIAGRNTGAAIDYAYTKAGLQIGSEPTNGPYFLAWYEPGAEPVIRGIDFVFDAGQHPRRPIAVAVDPNDSLFVAGVCRGMTTLPDVPAVDCGPSTLFIVKYNKSFKTLSPPRFLPQTLDLDDLDTLTVAVSDKDARVYVGGTFEGALNFDLVQLTSTGEDGFVVGLDAAMLTPAGPVHHITDGELFDGEGSRQRVQRLLATGDGVYVGGDFVASVRADGKPGAPGEGVFLARLNGDTLSAPVSLLGTEGCELQDLAAAGNYLHVAARACGGIFPSDGGIVDFVDPPTPPRNYIVRVTVKPDPAAWSWPADDIFSLKVAPTAQVLAPTFDVASIDVLGDDLLVAGTFEGEIPSRVYEPYPLSHKGGATSLTLYDSPDDVDPWAVQVPAQSSNFPTMAFAVHAVAKKLFLLGTTSDSGLKLDGEDIKVPGAPDVATDIYVLHFDAP